MPRGRRPRWRGGANRHRLEHRGSDRVPARRQGEGQARHLHPVRQCARVPGQPQRPIGSRADASPQELPRGQRHARHPGSHRPDLPHGRRDPQLADGPLPGPPRAGRVERVRLLRPEQHDRGRELLVVVQVLDGQHRRRQPGEQPADPVRRHELQHGQQRPGLPRRHGRGAQRPGAVGALHEGRLRRRRRRAREHRAREQHGDHQSHDGQHDPCGRVRVGRHEHQGRIRHQPRRRSEDRPRDGDSSGRDRGNHRRRDTRSGRDGRHPRGAAHESPPQRRCRDGVHARTRPAT